MVVCVFLFANGGAVCCVLCAVCAVLLQARDMYERMFAMKFLPPGRGLWAMVTQQWEQQ